MAVPRDPAFWKRFSVAVHMDEEAAQSPNRKLQHQDSWLYRQNAKSAKRTRLCWCFWIGLLIFVAAIVAVIIWLLKSGILKMSEGQEDGDASSD